MKIGAGSAADRQARFFFEREDCDLPFYRGSPVEIGAAGWLIVLASVALAFAALITAQQQFQTGIAVFVPALLFTLTPLAALALVAGPRAPRALFRAMRGRDWLLIPGFFILNAFVTVLLGLIVSGVFHGAANPAGARVAEASGLDRVLFFGWTAIQLLGEEIFTILPFLAALTCLVRILPRRTAIAIAALAAAVIFALVHLPTYRWNVAQALIGLVPIRIVLLLPYLVTRNIWVSAGTHIMNDWVIFGLALTSSGASPE